MDGRTGNSKRKLLLALLCMTVVALQTSAVLGVSPSLAQSSSSTWDLLDSGYPDARFWDVAFVDSARGWVVGQKNGSPASNLVVLYTHNGGGSWELQYDQSEESATVVDVVDEQTVWLNGGDGRLLHTIDGGITWTRVPVAGVGGALSTVEFVNYTHGWTANKGVLYRTTDGGQTWQSVLGWDFQGDHPRNMAVLSGPEIWACGYFGTYHSVNGGETWAKKSNGGGWAMSFVSDEEAWIVDDDRLAHMTDGKTWVELTVPGGLPWLRLRGPYLTDIQFIDKDNGWIVGQESPVMYTPDGGANWYRQSVPAEVTNTQPRIYAIHCIDQTHGWAVGSLGTIMRTTSANSTGQRLWGGSGDPVIFSVIAAVTVVVATGGVVILRRRRRRTIAATPDTGPNPEGQA